MCKVWGTSELIVSFDGAVVFRDPAADPSWQTMAGWWHVDQHYLRCGADDVARE